jgi:cobalt-precorrin-5B (C1)-methyltransferase
LGQLRTGFTTGTCAAAAAKVAATLFATGRSEQQTVEISLPGGERVELPVAGLKLGNNRASAAVQKNAGDDPDITNGVFVEACVSPFNGEGIKFEAGRGVGMVTKKGLSLPPGEPAINPVPRKSITEAVREVTQEPLVVKISIRGGNELAKRTFNPRLGIVGGLSVLGTTGIVRPYSHPALKESLKCTLDVAKASGANRLVFTVGNIGTRVAITSLRIPKKDIIEVSNEWGFMLDCLARHTIYGLLVLGHPGKLAKLSAGDWDTHSARSKSAVPTVLSLAQELLGKRPEESNTVDGIFNSLADTKRDLLGTELSKRIRDAVLDRTGHRFDVAVALVSIQGNFIGHYGSLDSWSGGNR